MFRLWNCTGKGRGNKANIIWRRKGNEKKATVEGDDISFFPVCLIAGCMPVGVHVIKGGGATDANWKEFSPSLEDIIWRVEKILYIRVRLRMNTNTYLAGKALEMCDYIRRWWGIQDLLCFIDFWAPQWETNVDRQVTIGEKRKSDWDGKTLRLHTKPWPQRHLWKLLSGLR